MVTVKSFFYYFIEWKRNKNEKKYILKSIQVACMIFIQTAIYHVTKNNKPCSVVSKFLGMVWRLAGEGRPLLFPILEKRKGLLLDIQVSQDLKLYNTYLYLVYHVKNSSPGTF